MSLVLGDNKMEGRNVSSFIGVARKISIANNFKKFSKGFKLFLKRNASCGATISVLLLTG